jgi:uracil-DNA glycosylase
MAPRSARLRADPLAALLAGIRGCRICRDAPRFGAALPHEPRPVVRVARGAPVLVAGQAPGTRVHASGAPFTDPSGVRLRQWMGVDEAAFYDLSKVGVAAMGFCFPGHDPRGGDLPPRRECAAVWHDRLFAALPGVEMILAVGVAAQRYHLARLGLARFIGPTLTDTVARWRDIRNARVAPLIYPLPHPSWRNNAWIRTHPWFEADLLPALRADLAPLLAAGDGGGRRRRPRDGAGVAAG